MTPQEMYEAHGLLHELWSATDDPGKKLKPKWGRLQEIMGRAFCELLGVRDGWLVEVRRRIS
jgi:hypothetical protein